MSYVASWLGNEGFGSYFVEWNAEGPTFERVHRPPEVLLVPGFVDVHIHGAFGIDFMSADQADLLAMSNRLASLGYEAFLPTTVTAGVTEVERALSCLPDHPMMPGFHLEGPFISPAYPGAQPIDHIEEVPEGPSAWSRVLDDRRLKVITLAPELPRALDCVLQLAGRGVRVSMGHSNATYEEARRGYEFGALCTTHTFNAMRPFHHREAGLAGYALTNEALYGELIYDRQHVSKEAAALLLKAKRPDRVLAVSDSTLATGLAPGMRVDLWGQPATVGRGEVRLDANGALAGSAITLADAFRNLFEDFGPEIAIRTCSINPRQYLGLGEPRVFLEMTLKGELLNIRRTGGAERSA
jgi:N-acetylglucosamine-6-phosphate deacetylase